MRERFAVQARRSGDGYMSAATALAKDRDGDVMYFSTLEDARAQAGRWNKQIVGFTVSYRAVDLEPEGTQA